MSLTRKVTLNDLVVCLMEICFRHLMKYFKYFWLSQKRVDFLFVIKFLIKKRIHFVWSYTCKKYNSIYHMTMRLGVK